MAPLTRNSKAKARAPCSAATNIRNRCRRTNGNATRPTDSSAHLSSVSSELAPPPIVTNEEPTSAPAAISNSNENNSIDFLDAAAISGFISNSNVVVGDSDERIRNLNSNTSRYSLAKKNAFKKFFEALANHPSLFELAEEVDDPECGEGEVEYRLIILCRGVKTKAKYNILNSALLVTASNVKKLTHSHVDLAKR